jgi:hypothetical protein
MKGSDVKNTPAGFTAISTWTKHLRTSKCMQVFASVTLSSQRLPGKNSKAKAFTNLGLPNATDGTTPQQPGSALL